MARSLNAEGAPVPFCARPAHVMAPPHPEREYRTEHCSRPVKDEEKHGSYRAPKVDTPETSKGKERSHSGSELEKTAKLSLKFGG